MSGQENPKTSDGGLRIFVALVAGVAIVLIAATVVVVMLAGRSDLRARISTPMPTAAERLADAIEQPTLAVVPLLAEDGTHLSAEMVDSVTATIAARMNENDFRVAAADLVEQFRDKDTTPAEVGEILRVRYVLLGTVGGVDGEARIDVVLHDVVMGMSIFRGSFYGQMASLASLNGEVIDALMVVLENIRS